MTSDAHQDPQPGRRGETDKPPLSRPGERRPLQRAGRWTRENWRAARARISRAGLKKPSRRALTWTGGGLGLLVIGLAVLIAVWDWNWFRGPLERMASARLNRDVTIEGDLRVRPWSWQPSATVEGVRIADPSWAGGGRMADIGRIGVRIRLLPLLTGDVDLRRLQFDQPRVKLYRDGQGRATWDFSDGRKPAEPLRLPPIRNFVINDGHLSFRDLKRDLTFDGTLNASERLGARNPGFEMRGQGTLNEEPFTLRLTGGPLVNIERDKPYPFDADVRAGQTYVTARGAVPKPFDLGRFHMNTTARGPDLADLYNLTGVALPNTPPYHLNGRLSRDEHLWRITGLGGRVGSSDLTGRLSVKTGGARPLLTADLRSRSLDFPDLGAIIGGAPKPGKVASPRQVAAARVLQAQQRILPDARLDVRRIRSIDADVTYRAVSIRNAPVDLRSGSVRVKLNAGLLRADPLTFEMPRGRITGEVRLDARKATPVTDLDLRLSNARLEQLVTVKLDGGAPFTGALVGRAKLRGEGDSVHKAFANADGEMMLAAPGGEIRAAFAELMGVNVVRGLGLLLSDSRKTTPIRCGVAHFRAVDGVLTADRIVFDTGPVLITGRGTVNMATELVDFRVQGHAKKFRLVRVLLPVTAKGPLRNPDLGVDPGKAIGQSGLAAALGSLVAPLAAILPFVDPGLAKDANCGALIAEAAAHGAPVRTAAR